jgi:hypothetical protein
VDGLINEFGISIKTWPSFAIRFFVSRRFRRKFSTSLILWRIHLADGIAGDVYLRDSDRRNNETTNTVAATNESEDLRNLQETKKDAASIVAARIIPVNFFR